MSFDLRLNDLKSFDVVGFGITTLDYVCLVDRIASYQKQANINNIKFFGGGCVSTALIVVQRMGAQTSLITTIGDDWIGREVLKGLKEENIDCRAVTCIKDMMSSFSFVQVNKKLGKRAIAYFPGAGGLLKFTDSAARIIKKGKILLLDSLSPGENLKAAKYAHENNIKVMMDCNVNIEGTKELLEYIDYLITSESFLYDYTKSRDIGLSLRKLYKDFKPEVLVTTLGKKGSVAIINNEIVDFGIFDVKVKDTTGCGDVYHGAFLFGILNNWKIIDIMIFATATASLKCLHYGGRSGIPNFKQTLEFLDKFDINIENYKLQRGIKNNFIQS